MIVEKELKQSLAERFKKKEYSAFVKTFGCQQNEADSEKIKGFLHSLGFGFVDVPLLADLILFNTCAVRHTAENKILGQLGELKNIKKINPKILIVLCGCMVEQEDIKSLIKEKYNFVDLICGAKSLDYFPRLLYKFLTGKSEWLDRNEVASKVTKILLSLILGYFIAGFCLFYLAFKFIAALVRGR